ncbi:MAG TPA: hypothetical protein VN784_04335 [Candidatus Limnocylindrales bacterium]|nr:hypothetical protein [Candidatus Limnocylindrales bacterium]
MEEREEIVTLLSIETFSAPEWLADENEEPGRLADKGFRTGRDANIVKTLRREPAARKLIPFRAMSDLGCGAGASRRFI